MAEYLAVTQPAVLAALEALIQAVETPAWEQDGRRLVDVTARLFEVEDTDPTIERLMRHDAYRRGKGGALRQVVHA